MNPPRPETPTPPRAHGPRGRLTFPGPLLLLFPLLAFAIGVARLQHRRPSPGGYPAPPSQGRAVSAEAWVGRPGGVLRGTLTRLHAGDERQRFDTQALRRRLDLGPGEPWRLELLYTPAAGDDAPPLALSNLAVRDAEGLKLVASDPPAPPPDRGVADPVAVWFAPPRRLEPGRTTTVLLWGEEPGADARVVGAGVELLLTRSFQEVPERGSLLAKLAQGPDGAVLPGDEGEQ